MGRLFNPDNFVGAQDGAGNNWAKGYFSYGSELIDEVLDQVRRQVEQCESVQGFQIMHSIGGGTGSGLGSLVLEKLSEEYCDKLAFNFSIFPGSTNSVQSDCVTEPYNAIMSLNRLIEDSQACFTIENSALHRIAQKNLKIAKPTFSDINHLVALGMADATATSRFPGYQNNCDIRKIATNLVAFPRLHFLMQGQAPLFGLQNQQFEKLSETEVCQQMFDSRCLFSDAGDLSIHGKILTASCLFRGKNVSAYQVEKTISSMKNKHSGSFVEWIPDNMMTSICKIPGSNKNIPVSGSFIANTTAQSQSFRNLLNNYEKMLKAKAYVHWYTAEGMDLDEFHEAGANVADLISEYT